MKLVGRAEGLVVGLLHSGVSERSGFVKPSWVICEDLDVLLECTGAGTDMISVTAIALFLNGDRLRFFSIRLGSPAAGAGEGDLEVEDRKDLRAMLRIVPVTDLPGPLAFSLASTFCCLGSVLVVSSCSLSAGRLNLAPPNLLFAFLDALRNSSLFATYPVPLVLFARSGGKDKIFSEYVRFNPLPIDAPARVTSAELAARGKSLAPLFRLGRCS